LYGVALEFRQARDSIFLSPFRIEMNTLAAISEFAGTFLLLLSILATGNAFIIGATLAVIILLIGATSGGHVNPAVSLAMYVKGALSLNELVIYVVSQALGGVAAVYAYRSFA
jgi:glycerol uptake facilitator-like aquaporin